MATRKAQNLFIQALHGEISEYKAAKALNMTGAKFTVRTKQWVKSQIKVGNVSFKHLVLKLK